MLPIQIPNRAEIKPNEVEHQDVHKEIDSDEDEMVCFHRFMVNTDRKDKGLPPLIPNKQKIIERKKTKLT